MDTDITKPDRGAMHIDRPQHQSSLPTSQTPTTASRSPEVLTPGAQDESVDPPFGSYTEPISEGEEDEDMDLAPVRDEAQHMKLDSAQVSEAIKFREEALKQDRERELRLKEKQKAPETNGNGIAADDDEDDESARRKPFARRRSSAAMANAERPRNLAIDPLAPSSQFDKTFWSKLNGVQQQQDEEQRPKKGANGRHVTIAEEDEDEGEADDEAQPHADVDEDATIFVQNFRAEPGKKISVPVRIEPKVIFANERTFMKWLHFSVLVGTIATTLLNFVTPEDGVGLISALFFTIAALLSIAYSGGIFAYRAYSLRHRIAEGWYHDPYGPTVLVVVLTASILVNLGLRLREGVTGENFVLFTPSP